MYKYLEIQEKPVGRILARIDITSLSFFETLKKKTELEASVNPKIYKVNVVNTNSKMPTFDL